MRLDILCTPEFTDADNKTIDLLAATLGVSRESAVRKAVKFFCAKCVPTHSAFPGCTASSLSMCAHTRRPARPRAARGVKI